MSITLTISHHAPSELTPYERNARTHSRSQIKQIAGSIETFGFTNPVLINEKRGIIAGHGRVEAAKLLGLRTIPAIVISHLSPEKQRALILADNKIALNAGWNKELLQIELGDLVLEVPDIDLTVTGFEMAEIDLLIGTVGDELEETHSTEEDIDPDLSGPPLTRLGDLWALGDHRVLCGDSLKTDNWAQLMNGAQAQMVFTDPPYNVPIQGHVSGKGKHQHREFMQASGEMSREAFKAFLGEALNASTDFSKDGSLHFVCMDWRHIEDLLSVGRSVFDELKNICVWNKTNGGMGSLYRSRHELVAVFKKGTAPHINNVQLGRFGRYRSNVWNYPGANSFTKNRDKDLADHPTVKPLALVKDAILDVTHIGDIVIDGFLGSGTTLLAADSAQRVCYGIELDPTYVDVILRRFQERTGQEPVLLSTDERLSDIQKQRADHAGSTLNENFPTPPNSQNIMQEDQCRKVAQ